jgi:hypothetical protein
MVRLVARYGDSRRRMDRLSEKTLESILAYARRGGLLVFIDSNGELVGYPKTSKAFSRVKSMLEGVNPEMKMHIIRTTRGEE